VKSGRLKVTMCRIGIAQPDNRQIPSIEGTTDLSAVGAQG
jgi:hypothetical protein